jgi:dTDP-4-dehydrorhamnose 3,5-epimerase
LAPAGFARGLLVPSNTADFLYKTTDYSAPAHGRAIRWDDKALSIEWLDSGIAPQLSTKGAAAPHLDTEEVFGG